MNHIINVLLDCPEVELISFSSESRKTMSDHMQASVSAALLDMNGETASTGAVRTAQKTRPLPRYVSPAEYRRGRNTKLKFFPFA